jgi:hypothetical protein
MGLKDTGRQLAMRARLSRALSYGAPFRLEITDETSRMVILDLELDAEAFADFMSNREAQGMAGVSKALHRIGKIMEHDSLTFPGPEFGNQLAAEAEAEAWRKSEGWDTVSVARNNAHNWVMVGRRWVDPQ